MRKGNRKIFFFKRGRNEKEKKKIRKKERKKERKKKKKTIERL